MAQPSRVSRTFLWGLLAAAAAIAAAVIRRLRLSPVRVEGDSMSPTLPPGALVAVRPRVREPARGQVVVVRRPDGTEHLKRVVGTPGTDGLGPNEFAVEGDNRAASTDSRHYGPVRHEDVVAVAVACYWPPRAWGALSNR